MYSKILATTAMLYNCSVHIWVQDPEVASRFNPNSGSTLDFYCFYTYSTPVIWIRWLYIVIYTLGLSMTPSLWLLSTIPLNNVKFHEEAGSHPTPGWRVSLRWCSLPFKFVVLFALIMRLESTIYYRDDETDEYDWSAWQVTSLIPGVLNAAVAMRGAWCSRSLG